MLSQLEKQLARVLPADCVLIMRITSKTLDNGFEKEHKHGALSTGRFYIQKVREFISNASASEVIQIQNLKLEAPSTLSLCQVKYLQILYEDRQPSTEAVDLISEYVDNFPRNQNTNLEQDDAYDDDSNNNDDDDDDDDKDNDDIDDDADNDDNGDDDNNGKGDDDNDDDY